MYIFRTPFKLTDEASLLLSRFCIESRERDEIGLDIHTEAIFKKISTCLINLIPAYSVYDKKAITLLNEQIIQVQ
jgi:hypothetical protein